MKLNLCIDIDGTITEPFYWLEKANEYFGTDIKPFEVTSYEIDQVLKIPREDYLNFYKIHGEEMHSNAEIREGAGQILQKLGKQHEIFYVSAREHSLEKTTKEWFYRHNLPKGKLYLLGTHYKVDKARELNCDIFIEDRYENAIQLADKGFEVLLIDCFYNQGLLTEGVTRIFNWRDIYDFIEEYSHGIDNAIKTIERLTIEGFTKTA
ncbi:hypothetical protein [Proteiniborus sp.]|uniref:5' nucleotidase, NT5C type n=1 Tax=Proteiniborus sp. TaxID=2079015 RepID=UPI00331EA11B